MTLKSSRRRTLIPALRRRFPAFESLWSRFPDNIFIVRCERDGRFIIEAVNPPLERLLGKFAGELAGCDVASILPEPTLSQVLQRYRECCASGLPMAYEESSELPGQSLQHWTTLLVPAVDRAGAVQYIFGISRDVTTIRHAEDLLRRTNEELERRVVERTAALASANALLRELATRDSLTNFYNRRHFFELAERELGLARRGQRPMAVLMLDLDRFKDINDTLGHAAGDLALREIADICRLTLRQTDIVGRYGGEEFAVLLPDTDVGSACTIADRLRTCIAQLDIPWHGSAIHCTVSVGLAHFNADLDSSIDSLVDRADRALLQAKTSGRNRLVVAA